MPTAGYSPPPGQQEAEPPPQYTPPPGPRSQGADVLADVEPTVTVGLHQGGLEAGAVEGGGGGPSIQAGGGRSSDEWRTNPLPNPAISVERGGGRSEEWRGNPPVTIHADPPREDAVQPEQLRPEQCSTCCTSMNGNCGKVGLGALFITLAVIAFYLGLQQGLLFVCGIVPGAVILGCFHGWKTRRKHATLDLCCRMALIALGGLAGYFIGLLAFSMAMKNGTTLTVILVIASLVVTAVTCTAHKQQGLFQRSRSNNDIDITFPGYQLPSFTGLGNWYFGDVQMQWVSVFIAAMCTLGVLASTFMAIGAVTVTKGRPQTGNWFITAFFSAALMEELYKYLLICTARAIRRHRTWNEEVLILALWGVVAFATLENLLYITVTPVRMTSDSGSQFQVALLVAAARAGLAVPTHCFTGMITALGVMQCYTVKRTTAKGFLILLLHFLLAVCLHGTYDFVLFLTSDNPSFFVVAIVIVLILALLINPISCCLLYKTWKRQRIDLAPVQEQSLLEPGMANDGEVEMLSTQPMAVHVHELR